MRANRIAPLATLRPDRKSRVFVIRISIDNKTFTVKFGLFMRTRGARIFSFLIPAAWFFAVAPVSALPATTFSVSILPPAASFEFDDLDLRDAQNRPIKSSASRSDMRRLFESNLSRLLLNNWTPIKQATHRILATSLDFWNQIFRRPLPASNQAAVIPMRERRELQWFTSDSSLRSQTVERPGARPQRHFSFQQSLLSSFLDSIRLLR